LSARPRWMAARRVQSLVARFGGSGVSGLAPGLWVLSWALGSGVLGLGSGVQALGSGVSGPGFWLWGLCCGSGLWGLWSKLWALGSAVLLVARTSSPGPPLARARPRVRAVRPWGACAPEVASRRAPEDPESGAQRDVGIEISRQATV